MVSKENTTLSDSLEEIFEIGLDHKKFSEAEIEEAKELYLIKLILIVVTLLGVSILGNIYLQKKKIKYLNESIFAILVGLAAGMVISNFYDAKYLNSLTQGYVKVFIIFLLPPIIFESSYNIKKKEFLKNFGTILLYAILGTIISIFFIGYFLYYFGNLGYYIKFTLKEAFSYGALISATDPVCILSAFKDFTTDPNFFLLVFGESILNDAVSMVFYDTVVELHETDLTLKSVLHPMFSFLVVLIGSSLIGLVVGFLASLLIKKISETEKKMKRIEVGFLISIPWITYLITSIFGFSGILSIFFLGISFSIYAKPFISKNSREFVHHFYEEIAAKAEVIVFIFIGIAFFSDLPFDKVNVSLPLILIILCLIGRGINIGFCSYLANKSRSPASYIDAKKQFFLWFAGVRGAMAFALAIKSKFDLPRVGSIFFLLTLLVTAFTLIYSAFFLEYTLNQCDVILREDNKNPISNRQQAFPHSDGAGKKVMFKVEDSIPKEEDAKEIVINHSFLHEDLDQYDEYNNNKDKNYNENFRRRYNNNNPNYFAILKDYVVKFNEEKLIPMVNREERVSIQSNFSGSGKRNLDNFNLKDLKMKFLENKDDEI